LPTGVHTFDVVATLCVLGLTFPSANTQNPVHWKATDQVLGRSGNLQGETYRVGFPRNDLHVTVGAVTMRPSLAPGSWVAFKQTDDSTAMLMGDLVLLPVEVGSVIDGHTGTPAPVTTAAPPLGLDTVQIAQVLGVHGKANAGSRAR